MTVLGALGRKRVAHAAMAAAAVCAFGAALPSAVAAVSDLVAADDSRRSLSIAAGGDLGGFTPASADPRLLASLASIREGAKGDAGMFRFTPAGVKEAASRAVTVAVRVDSSIARSNSLRKTTPSGETGLGVAGVAPVAFNLGMARGYQSFSQSAKISDAIEPGLGKNFLPEGVKEIDAPDLSRFTPAKKKSGESRFGGVVELNEGVVPGRAPRTFADGEQSVDVSGSYRVTGNLRVTAGVRYSAERERLGSIADGQQDNQSVYVGTRFRF